MKGTLSHGSARLVERLVSFFLLPILTKIITPAEYAIWSQTIIIAGLLTSVISLKFESSIIKFYPTWNNQKKKKDSIMLFILTSTLVLFFLVSIIALVFDEKISQLIFGDRQLTMYIPLIIGLLFSELLFDHLWVMLRISNRVNKLSIYIIIKFLMVEQNLKLYFLFLLNSFYLKGS